MKHMSTRIGVPLLGAIALFGVTAMGGGGKSRAQSAARAVTTRIEPGTPAEYLTPRVHGYTPLEIRKDGTQVYAVPVRIKNPDGTFRVEMGRLEASPAPVADIQPQLLQVEKGPVNR
jgi:hypothetical protein